jgi:hypothetical protein
VADDLVDTITQWLKKATSQSTGKDRLEFANKVDKAHRSKNARELERLVSQFKRSGPGFKREVLTILSACNVDAYGMFSTLGR